LIPLAVIWLLALKPESATCKVQSEGFEGMKFHIVSLSLYLSVLRLTCFKFTSSAWLDLERLIIGAPERKQRKESDMSWQ
jgi:hypothetical protein